MIVGKQTSVPIKPKKKPKPKKYKISNHTLLFRLIFFNNFIYLLWLPWVFTAVRAVCHCVEQELLFSCGAQASHAVASLVPALRLSSCGTRVWLLHST